ncbi:MAG TPA: HIT domain-containing protein [bacterium]|jgi:ATP adenylyltransferase|nr:HIT domain-containing protein [bacterium]
MHILWAPWRIGYVTGPKDDGCFLCEAPAGDDDRTRLLLHRSRRVYIVLNSFPYNTGHLMVAPFRHVATLEDLDAEERLDLMDTAALAVSVLQSALAPDGFNLGVNLGRAAGAGLEGHLHLHVVPRWVGDVNFMPVLGDAKVIPEHLGATYNKLATALAALGAAAES